MKNYKNSNLRMTYLLALFAIIVYHIINGKDETVQILAGLTLTVWILAIKPFFEKENK